jgi:formate hydrogenlyase subunit 6/NADH:ubiquinone oxidoreductase subunit I
VRGGANSVQNENSVPVKKSENSTSTLNKKSIIDLPKVNTELCIGCGACVNVCPMNAITVVNGKATISEDKCRNCRICQRTCPVEAIS